MPQQYIDAFMIINLARTLPKLFAKTYLDKFKTRFVPLQGEENPSVYVTMDRSRAFRSFEGLHALEECIKIFRSLTPVKPLNWDNSLFMAARDHVLDIGNLGLYGH